LIARLARANVAIVTTLAAGILVAATLLARETGDWITVGLLLVVEPFTVVIAVLGWMIVKRRPENRMGPGFCLATLVFSATAANELFLTYALDVHETPLRGTATAALVSEWVWVLAVLPVLTFLFLLSPDGHLPSPRWRPVAWAISGTMVMLLLGTMFSPLATRPTIANPYQIDALGGLPNAIRVAGLYGVPPSIAASAIAMIVRFRRSRGVERQQLKWLASSAALAGTLIVVALATAPWIASDIVFSLALFGGAFATLSSTAFGILRYRLYDIDLIIRRTLVYGSLTAATIASYVGIVAVLSWSARMATDQQNNELVVAATTLIVAALFQPARRRIQSLVDRRFYRSRYDAARIVESLQSRLRDETDIEAVRARLAAAVSQALQPGSVNVWIGHRGSRNDPVARSPYGEDTP